METRTVPDTDFITGDESSNTQDTSIVPNLDIVVGPMTFREHLRAFCLARQARKRSGLPNLQEIVPMVRKSKKKHKRPLK
jgi:hypothetical protein